RLAEDLVRAYRGTWLIVRPGNVYGPGDDVISLLLKMVRSLPVMPVLDDGGQRFQPIWHADLGQALLQAVERDDLANQTLEVAGAEITTMTDLLDRLALLTGRNPARVPVPSLLAGLGVRIAENLPFTDTLARVTGIEFPI